MCLPSREPGRDIATARATLSIAACFRENGRPYRVALPVFGHATLH
jgi:hypothetical protein